MAGTLEPAATHPPQARVRELLAAGFVVAFIVVQLLVPALKLAEPRPARFGWQMYAAVPPRADFAVVLADGSSVRTSPQIYQRHDVRFEEIIPPQLCRQIPDARSVQVSVPARSQQWEFRCP